MHSVVVYDFKTWIVLMLWAVYIVHFSRVQTNDSFCKCDDTFMRDLYLIWHFFKNGQLLKKATQWSKRAVKRWATWGIPWERRSLWSFCRFPCSPLFSPLVVWTSWLQRNRGRSATERCTSGFVVTFRVAPSLSQAIQRFKRKKKAFL